MVIGDADALFMLEPRVRMHNDVLIPACRSEYARSASDYTGMPPQLLGPRHSPPDGFHFQRSASDFGIGLQPGTVSLKCEHFLYIASYGRDLNKLILAGVHMQRHGPEIKLIACVCPRLQYLDLACAVFADDDHDDGRMLRPLIHDFVPLTHLSLMGWLCLSDNSVIELCEILSLRTLVVSHCVTLTTAIGDHLNGVDIQSDRN